MILSPEIIDHILAFLYNNQRALAACSLVSSSWTDFARRRLFYTVKYVRGKWDESLYPSFLEFLESSPSIAQYVHVLSIEGERDQLYDYWGNLHPPTFAALLAALPNLEEVNIDGVSLHSTPEDGSFPEQHSSSVLPRSLKRVRFGKVTVDEENSCTTLLQFLCLISSIETLDIYQLSSDYEVTLSKVRNRRRMLDVLPNLGIRTLNISGGSATPGWVFLEAIRAAKPQTLRNLEYLYYEDEDNETDEFEGFQNFLDDVAGSLENLTISLRGAQSGSYPCAPFVHDLTHGVSLILQKNHPFYPGAIPCRISSSTTIYLYATRKTSRFV